MHGKQFEIFGVLFYSSRRRATIPFEYVCETVAKGRDEDIHIIYLW